MPFTEFDLDLQVINALHDQGITSPVLVQSQALPPLLAGRDVVINAPTGSGKTLAFLLPAAQGLLTSKGVGPRVLIVTPTRELAIQISAVWASLNTSLPQALLYGGLGYSSQSIALKNSPQIIIGTPGRILDMISRKELTLSRIEYLVLDEADEMLDAGFAIEVEKILSNTYEPQSVFASATMPSWVKSMIKKHMHQPLTIATPPETESLLESGLIKVQNHDKLKILVSLLRAHSGSAIVFARTKHGVKKLNKDLSMQGLDSIELQGNLSQTIRDRAMESFRQGRARILVATNVAARGLDIDHVGLVINYELPETAQWLTHRVGRTARNGAKGRALTFLSQDETPKWGRLTSQGAPNLPLINLELLLSKNIFSPLL